MARHQHIIAEKNKKPGAPSTTDPTCTLCGEGQESSAHILAECTKLRHLRLKYFSCEWLQPPYVNLDMKSVIGYLEEANMDALNFAFEKE